MKKCIVICGPESSGNHLVCSILNGRSNVTRPGDEEEVHTNELLEKHILKRHQPHYLAIQRSMPCDKKWWQMNEVIDILEKYDYQVYFIVLTRELFAMAQSQIHEHTPNSFNEAATNISEAYLTMFNQLSIVRRPFAVVSYESILHNHKAVISTIEKWFELNIPESSIGVVDNNSPWYNGSRPTKAIKGLTYCI